jgi:hypothetical protein
VMCGSQVQCSICSLQQLYISLLSSRLDLLQTEQLSQAWPQGSTHCQRQGCRGCSPTHTKRSNGQLLLVVTTM